MVFAGVVLSGIFKIECVSHLSVVLAQPLFLP